MASLSHSCLKLTVFYFLCAAITAPAAQAAQDVYLPKCAAATPSTQDNDYPGENNMQLSNNLVRPMGKAEDAPGQAVYLSGRVTDEKCIPVSGAIVDLWQTNPFGRYRWASEQELLSPLPIFAGNGRATTDNMGRYHFITLFPGTYGKNAPHIHVRVSHPSFPALQTTLYFRGDRRNAQDPKLQALSKQSRDLLIGQVTMPDGGNTSDPVNVKFDMTLKGKDTFRGY